MSYCYMILNVAHRFNSQQIGIQKIVPFLLLIYQKMFETRDYFPINSVYERKKSNWSIASGRGRRWGENSIQISDCQKKIKSFKNYVLI